MIDGSNAHSGSYEADDKLFFDGFDFPFFGSYTNVARDTVIRLYNTGKSDSRTGNSSSIDRYNILSSNDTTYILIFSYSTEVAVYDSVTDSITRDEIILTRS